MLNFGTGRVSVLNSMITIAITPRALIRAITNPSALETYQEKSPAVIIPVLGHVKLHVGTGRVSVGKIMIKIAISQEPH